MRSSRGSSGSVERRAALIAGLSLWAVVACEIPEAPEWEVGVVAPFSADPVSITDWLPSSMDTATLNGVAVFTLDAQRDSVGYSLGQMCAACRPLHGTTTWVPAFDYVDSLDVRFPEDVASVEVISARLGTRVRNRLNFDPLRPDPDSSVAGWVAIAIRDLGSGSLLDSVFISGAAESLPPDSTRQIDLQVSDQTISEGIRSVFYVHSPQDGQLVQIDTAMSASVASFLEDIQVTAVTAVVESDTLEEAFVVDFDQDVRDEISERVRSGTYELELLHDLEIAGPLQVSIAGSEVDLFSGDPGREVRLEELSLEAGRSQTGELTVAEIEQIANYPSVFMGYRAVASGTRVGSGGRVNLSRFTPTQALDTRLKLISRVLVGD